MQHLVEVEKENAAKLTELWSRIIFAVVPFVFVLVYVIVAAVAHISALNQNIFNLTLKGGWVPVEAHAHSRLRGSQQDRALIPM